MLLFYILLLYACKAYSAEKNGKKKLAQIKLLGIPMIVKKICT